MGQMLPLCWIKQFSQKWSGARGAGEGSVSEGQRCLGSRPPRSSVWMPRALCKCSAFHSILILIFKGKENIKKNHNNNTHTQPSNNMGACNFGKYKAPLFGALIIVDIFLFNLFPFLQGFSAWPISMGNNELYWALDTWTITNKRKTLMGSHPWELPFPFYPLNWCDQRA